MIESTSLRERLAEFMATDVYPNERVYAEQLRTALTPWSQPPIMEELKARARAQGLWNLFLPESDLGAGLSNRAYAPLCELMGRSLIAPEIFNCAAPDTGNMEVLARYGTPAQQERWLRPLLAGTIRSGFAMTEPDVASSDATNVRASVVRDGDAYVLHGRKWWTTGAAHPACTVLLFLGRSHPDAPRHQQHTMVIVPVETPGVRIVRTLSVFGYREEPHGHCEIAFEQVRVPRENVVLGEGRGFEIGQGRLGPGRLHHCLRLIGLAERALETMVARVKERSAFGKPLAEQGVIMEWIADSRIAIDQARLLTYDAAERLDREGGKVARHAIAMAKVVAPNVAQQVVDRAIQAFGAKGVSGDVFLAAAYAAARTLRIADGPDEVHRASIAKAELAKAAP
ncbi:MAG TPA: acyl-CoA dehydrogenase family protein [Candidatus Limnocylindria bacterium]|nr:acyl-CoA dehydrogenase family protein [Candidatus Limnocylindria bacterium]